MEQSLEKINTKIEKLNKKLDKLDYKMRNYKNFVTDKIDDLIESKVPGNEGMFVLIAALLAPITLLCSVIYVIILGAETIFELVCRLKIKKIRKKLQKLRKEKELLDLTNVDQKLQDDFKQLDKALKIDKVSDAKIEQLKDICKRLKLELAKLETVANKQSTNKTIAKEPTNLTADDDVTK